LNKSDKNNVSITYPVIDKVPYFPNLIRPKGGISDPLAKTNDTVMLKYNSLLEPKAKWIRVKGIAGLDTLISVYNQDGIKAAGLFDNRQFYTSELSVSLKQLGFNINGVQKIVYNIRINGAKPIEFRGQVSASDPATVEWLQKFQEHANARAARQAAPTDFWGEYVLAKK